MNVINNYNKLKRGKNKTYIILPPLQNDYFYDLIINYLNGDIEIIETFINNYETIDGLHPTPKIINNLNNDLSQLHLS